MTMNVSSKSSRFQQSDMKFCGSGGLTAQSLGLNASDALREGSEDEASAAASRTGHRPLAVAAASVAGCEKTTNRAAGRQRVKTIKL